MIVFWAAVALLAYIYLGYPLLAAARASLFPKPRRTAPIEPVVSVVVIAYNEETRIASRIENLLALDYPPGCPFVPGPAGDFAHRNTSRSADEGARHLTN